MLANQTSDRAERRPALKQLKQPTWARVAEAVFAVMGIVFTYLELTSESGSFQLALVSGYLAITSAAFALNIKARFGLALVGVLFVAAYVFHLSATANN